jgi:hypothetical protein
VVEAIFTCTAFALILPTLANCFPLFLLSVSNSFELQVGNTSYFDAFFFFFFLVSFATMHKFNSHAEKGRGDSFQSML